MHLARTPHYYVSRSLTCFQYLMKRFIEVHARTRHNQVHLPSLWLWETAEYVKYEVWKMKITLPLGFPQNIWVWRSHHISLTRMQLAPHMWIARASSLRVCQLDFLSEDHRRILPGKLKRK